MSSDGVRKNNNLNINVIDYASQFSHAGSNKEIKIKETKSHLIAFVFSKLIDFQMEMCKCETDRIDRRQWSWCISFEPIII